MDERFLARWSSLERVVNTVLTDSQIWPWLVLCAIVLSWVVGFIGFTWYRKGGSWDLKDRVVGIGGIVISLGMLALVPFADTTFW